MRVHESFRKELWFTVILPEDVIAGWRATIDGGIEYPTFLLNKAGRIAESYGWIINVQFVTAEDDPLRIDAWCEASKKEDWKDMSQEKVRKIVTEASEIFKKVAEMIKDQKRKTEIYDS